MEKEEKKYPKKFKIKTEYRYDMEDIGSEEYPEVEKKVFRAVTYDGGFPAGQGIRTEKGWVELDSVCYGGSTYIVHRIVTVDNEEIEKEIKKWAWDCDSDIEEI